MDVISFSIKKPVPILVAVIMTILFGLIGLYSMPYQLSPTVTQPEISVETIWPGATPYEIEREIIEEQEKVLKGIPNLYTMESTSYNNRGEVTLTFKVGTDLDSALLRVSNKLNEVQSYPENVEKPVISATGSAASPIVWMVMKTLPGNKNPINFYGTFFEDEVRQHLERVDGVADLFVFGGTEDEMHVVVDPKKLAAHKLTINDLIRVLDAENANVSAGNMYVGRREYRIRTVAQYQSPKEIESVVVTSSGQRRITVGDVARVGFGHAKMTASIQHNGITGMVCGIKPEVGANVLDVTNEVEAVFNDLNNGLLKEKGLYFDWAHDQRPYINGAIDLVKQNIMIGGCLAVIVLLVFLRSLSSTLVVCAAIPISIIGTFFFMNLFGRNLNVVSLAGISFAVGMLVDNAIVVLENIDRHRSMGKRPFQAAYDGASEVWGAILASTATTVAVFLPVVFMEQEAGQLFKDIAIAVTCAIILSMFVSISVIPMLSRLLFRVLPGPKNLGQSAAGQAAAKIGQRLNGLPKFSAVKFGTKVSDLVMSIVTRTLVSWKSRLATIAILTGSAILMIWILFPKMEYLPQGNQNFVLNILIPPPGLSLEERIDIGHYIFDQTKPIFRKKEPGKPAVDGLFYVGADRIMISGVTAVEEDKARELIPYYRRVISTIPGMYGTSIQAGIFQQSLGGGRSIDVDLSSGDMTRLVAGAGAMFGTLNKAIPGVQIRPVPSLELLFPEVKLVPERDRIRASGMTAQELGVALDVLMDGRKVGEYKEEGKKKIDLILKASDKDAPTPEALYASLVATPGGRAVPVSSLAGLVHTTGINQIRHLERQRTITLQVTPPLDLPLEQAMEIIRDEVEPNLRKAGVLTGISFRMSGAADKLTEARQALQWNFLLAVVIIYLLMSALFGNFIYPLVIMFSVPLAAAGGFLGLSLENILVRLQSTDPNATQPMDILTMLGFIILIGVVVNNAILIVHQSLNNVRQHDMGLKEAVLESVRTRLRPIYMSAFTSIFGMLPLAVAPGPGSELYRGLGSVVLGGLAVSTFFTVFLIPSLLLFVIGMEKNKDKSNVNVNVDVKGASGGRGE